MPSMTIVTPTVSNLVKAEKLADLASKYAKGLGAHLDFLSGATERLSDGLDATEGDCKAAAKSVAVTKKPEDAHLVITNARGAIAKVHELTEKVGTLIARTAKPSPACKDVDVLELRARWSAFAKCDKANDAARKLEAALDALHKATEEATEDTVLLVLGEIARARAAITA